jgi:hypothetical protein
MTLTNVRSVSPTHPPVTTMAGAAAAGPADLADESSFQYYMATCHRPTVVWHSLKVRSRQCARARVRVCSRAPIAHSLAPFFAFASTVETACHSLCAALCCVDRTGLPARTHVATHSVADVFLHVLVSALKRARLLLSAVSHVLSVQCTDLAPVCLRAVAALAVRHSLHRAPGELHRAR